MLRSFNTVYYSKMKKIQTLLLLLFCLVSANFCYAQQSAETVLRDLENAEREAILKGDTTILLTLLSPQIVVQNPENAIIKFDQMMERIRTGKIKYSSFERIIENISFVENIAIVMGKEIIMQQGNTNNTVNTITRRFTNIWMKTGNIWKLTARQATIISPK